jgi:hypothetical protein
MSPPPLVSFHVPSREGPPLSLEYDPADPETDPYLSPTESTDSIYFLRSSKKKPLEVWERIGLRSREEEGDCHICQKLSLELRRTYKKGINYQLKGHLEW